MMWSVLVCALAVTVEGPRIAADHRAEGRASASASADGRDDGMRPSAFGSDGPLGLGVTTPPTARVTTWLPSRLTDPRWRMTDLAAGNTLMQASILQTAFEPDGIAWVATTMGVFRGDGYSWRHYGVKDGVPTEDVRCVLPARDGSLWIGTFQGVLHAPAFRTRHFENARWIRFEDGLAGPSVRRIRESADGTVWICSDRWPESVPGAGLTRYSPDTNTLIAMTVKNGLPSDHVYDYFQDHQGNEYAFTAKGLAQRVGKGDAWENPIALAGLPGEHEPCFSAADSLRYGLFVSSRNGGYIKDPGGAGEGAGNPGTWRRVEYSGVINQVLATSDGEIWAGRPDGASAEFHSWNGEKFVPLTKDSYNFSRDGVWVEDLREAPDGSVWVSDQTHLLRWMYRGGEWDEFPNVPPPRFEDPLGRVWFWDDARVVRFEPDRAGAAQRAGRLAREVNILQTRGRWTLLEGMHGPGILASDGSVWFWDERGVIHWNPDDTNATVHEEREHGVANVQAVVADANKDLWLLGRNAQDQLQFARYDGRGWELTVLDPEEIRMKRIRETADPRGGIWVLLQDEHGKFFLIFLDRREKLIFPLEDRLQVSSKKWFTNWKMPDILDNIFLAADQEGAVWVSGPFSIVRLSNRKTWTEIDPRPLPGRSIRDIFACADAVWVFTSPTIGGRHGWARYRNNGWNPVQITRSPPRSLGRQTSDGTVVLSVDGMIEVVPGRTQELKRGSVTSLRPIRLTVPDPRGLISAVPQTDGTMWIGVEGGSVFHYHPDRIPPETRVQLGAGKVRAGTRVEVNALGVEKFLPSGYPHVFRYSWRIDGGDWSEWTADVPAMETQGFAEGLHTLEVQSMDESGDADHTPTRAELWIEPLPLQEKPYFLPVVSGIVVLLLGLTVSSFRFARGMQRAKDVAVAANRAKTTFLSAMSHELRTPMNGVLGLSRLLLETPLDAAQREHVGEILTSGNALSHVLNDLLDYTMLESGGLVPQERPLHLRDVMESALASASNAARAKGLVMNVSYDPYLPARMVGDAGRIGQIVNNLASNAVKYTLSGVVDVHIWCEADADLSTLAAVSRKDDVPLQMMNDAEPPQWDAGDFLTVGVEIRDTGVGIAPERLTYLLNNQTPVPGVSTGGHAVGHSAGLGLLISRKLIACLSGRFWAGSEVGKGSHFGFALPLRLPNADDVAVAPPEVLPDHKIADSPNVRPNGLDLDATLKVYKPLPTSTPTPAPTAGLGAHEAAFDAELGRRNPLRILLAEDMAINQRLMLAMLQRMGYSADLAVNGQEAIDALGKIAYDVVLMDIQMPVMDGLEASRRIQQHWPEHQRPRVVAVTANTVIHDPATCIAAGIAEVVFKPVKVRELAETLERAARWLRQQNRDQSIAPEGGSQWGAG